MSHIESNYHDGRLEGKCYFCESGPPLEEHHVIPQRFGGPDSKDNIVALCQLCHKRIERLYDSSFYEWFGVTDEEGKREFHRPCENTGCENTAKAKVKRISRDSRFHPRGEWPVDYGGLYCRPCIAKLSNDVFEQALERYEDRRETAHKHARLHHTNGNIFDQYSIKRRNRKTMRELEDVSSNLWKPESRSHIQSQLVVESAEA